MAIELDPGYEEAYSNRGRAYYTVGKHAEAFADLDKAIEINSDYAMAYLYRGIVHQDEGAVEAGSKDFRRHLDLEPDGSSNADDLSEGEQRLESLFGERRKQARQSLGAPGGPASTPTFWPYPRIGRRTHQPMLYDPNGRDRDCDDFTTWNEAQDFFEATGGPWNDPHGLAQGGDLACESLLRGGR